MSILQPRPLKPLAKKAPAVPASPTFPWEPCPASLKGDSVVWRYSANPIINRHPFPAAARVYNSAVVPFGGKYVGVFRADYKSCMPHLHVGWSRNAVDWEFESEPLQLGRTPGDTVQDYAYDPRVTQIGDAYYVTWCNGYHGPTIGVARTFDFVKFEQLENAFLPCNRNGVLFPRLINGHYAMLSRPSDQGHTPFGDIFYSESPDMRHWGMHRFVMGTTPQWWQSKKIGAGSTPIETPEGWLILYHGVCGTCSGFVYSLGAALLDLEKPWIVRYRSNEALLSPEESYETTGFVPNVIFPCATLHDEATGRLAIYYGSADTYTAMAFSQIDLLLEHLRTHSAV